MKFKKKKKKKVYKFNDLTQTNKKSSEYNRSIFV